MSPKTPDIPHIEGVTQMTPLEMNAVHFDKKHTVITPELLESMGKRKAQGNIDGKQ